MTTLNIIQSESSNKNSFSTKASIIFWSITIGTFLWFALGFIGFIYSLVCFGKNDKLGLNIVGLILAVLFGPFYWFYYAFNKQYCRSLSSPMATTTNNVATSP